MASTYRERALELIALPSRMAQMEWRAKQVASAMGLPDQFIASIRARRVSETHWQLTNGWTARNYHTGALDVPLGRFFEYGTRDHLVLPVYARALSWVETHGGREVRRFSAGHTVSGLRPLMPMTEAWREVVKELRRYISENLPLELAEWGRRHGRR